MLSDQLRNIANKARSNAEQQMGAQNAGIQNQVNQALTAGGGAPSKAAAQQIAGAATGAQQQASLQTQGQLGQQLQQIGQAGLQQQAATARTGQAKQQMLNDSQIAELQRQGVLSQSSKQLRQAKQLQQQEIETQSRMLSQRLQYDDKLSFMTRKQREDLANLGAYTKQQLFDSRLSFQQDEMGRKFSNMRQLADYAVASFKDDQQLQVQMREMSQAAEKEIMTLQHAHNMISQRLQLEFQRAEKTKDYALLKKLQKMKADMEAKIRRDQAKASAISNIIVGGATIAGAALGAGTGPQGALIGANIGSGIGQVATGGARGAGWY